MLLRLALLLCCMPIACGLDLERRDGELVLVLLDDVPEGSAVRVSIDGADELETTTNARGEVLVESTRTGPTRVRLSVPSLALVSNGPPVTVLETTTVSVGLFLFGEDVARADADGDGVRSADDNCPWVANPGQTDGDRDGIGDACDLCPAHPVPSLDNLDGDAFGDACDADIDGDGVLNVQDACPRDPTGSVDSDGDLVCDPSDNCPGQVNPDQGDCDRDSIGDACDDDIDGDAVSNTSDVCPFAYDPQQLDSDGDGTGDVCVADPTQCIPEAP